MSIETTINYQELKNGKAKLQQISSDLDNARSKKNEMVFNQNEIGGLTAGQAVYGFSSIYEELISVTSTLASNTESFLADVGVVFKEADDSAANEIKK